LTTTAAAPRSSSLYAGPESPQVVNESAGGQRPVEAGAGACSGTMISCCRKKARRHGPKADDDIEPRTTLPNEPVSISNPPSNSNSNRSSLPVAEVEKRMKKDGFAKYVTETSNEIDKRRIVSYLYGREMHWTLPRRQRVERIQAFLADGAIRERMNMVLAFFELGSSSTPRRDGDPNRSRRQHRVWQRTQEKILRFEAGKGGVDAGFTIFLKNGIPYIQFLQERSTSCYIAAPAALVSYLRAIAELGNTNSTGRVEPIDTHRYIRHRFTNDELERRVVGNHGGSSQDVLRDMVGSSDFVMYGLPRWESINEIDLHSRVAVSRKVVSFMTSHGPALVSSFDVKSVKILRASKDYPKDDNEIVYMPSFDVDSTGEDVLTYRNLGAYGDDPSIKKKIDAFESANEDSEKTHSAGGKSDGADVDRVDESKSKDTPSPSSLGGEGAADRPHAMILIGSRSDDADGQSKHWFLLQNSWESMPVLEVSYSFMARHLNKGDPVFVRRDVTAKTAAGIASGAVSTVAGLHHECNLDDGGEEAEDLIEEGPGDY
jgi:hypothetical protein